MGKVVNSRDLAGFKITSLDSGGVLVSASCPLCQGTVSLGLTAHDLETRRQAEVGCRSGRDWPRFFQLHARFSPDETDNDNGVDVWGTIEQDVQNEEYD